MKKVLGIVAIVLLAVICAVAGTVYVGYRVVKSVIANGGCVDCVQVDNGGPVIRGSGHLAADTRTVGNFSAVDVSALGADVVITRGSADGVAVIGDDNLLPLYTSEAKDGTLYLAFAKGKSFQGKMPTYRVTITDLRSIRVHGSGDVTANNLDGSVLSVIASGSSDIRLSGRDDDLTVSVTGSGSVDAAKLQAKQAKVIVGGSGDATVNASDALDVRVSGSGSVHYLGAPKLTKDVSGSGSVEHRQP